MKKQTQVYTGWNMCPKAYQGCPGPIESKDICLRICSQNYEGCHNSTQILSIENFRALSALTGCGTDLSKNPLPEGTLKALELLLNKPAKREESEK